MVIAIAGGTAVALNASSASRGPFQGPPPFSVPTFAGQTNAPGLGAVKRAASVPAAVQDLRGKLPAVGDLQLTAPTAEQCNRPGKELTVHLSNPNHLSISDVAASDQVWEAYLAQGALADEIDGLTGGFQKNLANVICGSSFTAPGPDGAVEQVGDASGDVAAGEIFGAQAQNLPDAAISDQVSGALKSFGLTSESITVLRPLGPAVRVTATVSSVEDLAGKYNDLMKALTDSGKEYEGMYLEVDLPDGTPILKTGYASRVASSILWFADGVDAALGIQHMGLYHPQGAQPSAPAS